MYSRWCIIYLSFHKSKKAMVVNMDRSMTIKYFRNIPTLYTDRMILRRILKTDYLDMFEYSSNPSVTKFLLWDAHTDERYTKRYLAYLQTRYHAGEFYDWALVEKKYYKMIGTCGFTSFDFENNSAEVGYVLNPRFWYAGLAAEALFEVMKFGFTVLELHRIEAKYMVGNENSRRVMEKLGMRFEGIARESIFVKGKYVSVGTCAITRNDFFSIFSK